MPAPAGAPAACDPVAACSSTAACDQAAPCDPVAAPAPAGAPAPDAAAPLPQRLARLEAAVTRHPLHREILYRTLAFCQQRRELSAIEDEIASYPEFARATQDQYHLIVALEQAGGLVRTPLDADGADVTPERLTGLTEDEADDLVATYAFSTTDAGVALVEQHAPRARLIELMGLVPERTDTYVELMAYLEEEPRTYAQICALLQGRPALLRVGPDGEPQQMQPSVFLDKLEQAGGVEWDEGWVLTREGREFLDELDRL